MLHRIVKTSSVLVLIALAVTSCRLPFPGSNTQPLKELADKISQAECDNEKRLAAVGEIFRKHGLEFRLERFENATNAVIDLDGDRETIVVGAHYDKTTLGCGAIDNWTGVVLLTLLAKSLKSVKNEKSYKFVAFGGEEKGLLGSRAMVDSFSRERKRAICAMVNLDSFGIDDAWALENISSRQMLMLAAEAERSRGGSLSIRSYNGASSDSEPFVEAGIPAITISGIDKDWRNYLHKESDQADRVITEKVFGSYQFVKAVLDRLDQADCSRLRTE